MHDTHTLGSFRTGISKYTAIKICVYMNSLTHHCREVGTEFQVSPFQVVTMKWTYRQNFSNLPKRLKEPLNSVEGVGKLHLRVPWPGGPQARGALHGAPALSCSCSAEAAAAPVQPHILCLQDGKSRLYCNAWPSLCAPWESSVSCKGLAPNSPSQLWDGARNAGRAFPWCLLTKPVEGGMTAVH